MAGACMNLAAMSDIVVLRRLAPMSLLKVLRTRWFSLFVRLPVSGSVKLLTAREARKNRNRI